MPELTWIGKEKVVNHHHAVPFRILEKQYTFNDDTASGNKIIHGDNLEALKALLPEYEGRVKCIYIDPPYNTGNENWVYNDNVNDPKLKKWLGAVVGKEGEDLSRHDKWLCMMYPRLKLLQRLLSDDGSIWVNLDDNEHAYAKAILDEIFGRGNFVANIIWQKTHTRENRTAISTEHDNLLVFAKDRLRWQTIRNPLPASEAQLGRYSNPDNDPRGVWASLPAHAKAEKGRRKEQFFTISTPSGRAIDPPAGRCWLYTRERFEEMVSDNRIWFGENGTNAPRVKKFLSEVQAGLVPSTIWTYTEVGTTGTAKAQLVSLFPDETPFPTPKPVQLIERILHIATNPEDIVLDSFAGSGTTAHAVLKLNAADGGNRKFILIEQEEYAETITAERVRRVMSGYGEDAKRVEGLGGAFDFHTVGAALFDARGNLDESIGVEEIRRYIAYTENVREPLPVENERSPYLLGLRDETAYFFYYDPEGATTLDLEFLAKLNFRPAETVVYADKCLLTREQLQKYNIVFKKIPRDITRF